jgi:hypothetical protein
MQGAFCKGRNLALRSAFTSVHFWIAELRRLVGFGGPQREVRNENLRIDHPYRNGT